MFPVLFASVSGFIIIGHDNLYDGASWFKPANPDNESTTITSFAQLSLFLGVLNSLPAIFFTFDGFHNVASLQSELREPKKMPKTMCIGTTIVAALEIIVAVSLLIGCKDGSLFGIKSKLFSQIFIQIMLICVIIGMLSVVGSNACFAPRFYESLISHNECPKFLLKYKKSLNSNRPIVGSVITSIVFLSTLFIVALAGYFF
jgi:amino acid transporter